MIQIMVGIFLFFFLFEVALFFIIKIINIFDNRKIIQQMNPNAHKKVKLPTPMGSGGKSNDISRLDIESEWFPYEK